MDGLTQSMGLTEQPLYPWHLLSPSNTLVTKTHAEPRPLQFIFQPVKEGEFPYKKLTARVWGWHLDGVVGEGVSESAT